MALLATGAGAAAEWYVEESFQPSRRIEVRLVNPLAFARVGVPVTLRREELPFGNVEDQAISVVDPTLDGRAAAEVEEVIRRGPPVLGRETHGRRLAAQVDDLDQDGLWDELFFMVDMPAAGRKSVYLYLDFAERGLFAHATHAMVGVVDRHIVPWWESELFGWYLWYGDSVDIVAKRRPALMAHELTTRDESAQASPRPDGNDILLVGDTFGAGGIGVLEDPEEPASLVRPRFSPQAGKGPLLDTRFAHRTLASGPLRSIVQVDTLNWRTAAGEYALRQRFTAYAGKPYSICQASFPEFRHEDRDVAVGIGVRRLMNEAQVLQEDGCVVSFGAELRDIWFSAEHLTEAEKQPIPWLGLGLAVRRSYAPRYLPIEQYGGNHLLSIPLPPDRSFEYMMLGGWSEGFENTDRAAFEAYVRREVEEYNHPLEIELGALERR